MTASMPLRWLWYLLRLAFCAAYAVVAFFSKSGARYLVTVGMAVGAWLFFPWVQALLHHAALWLYGSDQPDRFLFSIMLALSGLWLVCVVASVHGTRFLLVALLPGWWLCFDSGTRAMLLGASAEGDYAALHIVLVGALLVFTLLALALLARVLALVLGTFPPPAWPLRPRAVLKAKNRVIAPAPVTLAVPRLQPPATRPPHDLHAALPPELAALLTPRPPPALP
jgi:hypothetical protein